MKIRTFSLAAIALAISVTPALGQDECPGDPGYVLTIAREIPTGAVATAFLDTPGAGSALLLFSNGPGPTGSAFGDLCVTFPLLAPPTRVSVPASGRTLFECVVQCEPQLVGRVVFLQFVALLNDGRSGRSNSAKLTVVDGGCGARCPAPAEADQFGGAGGHAVTFGCGDEQAVKYVFTDGRERFIENGDGTARLIGTLVDPNDPTNRWLMDVRFSGRVDPGDPNYPPPGSPHKELAPAAYVENGGPVDPSTWYYYLLTEGDLVGEGSNAGCMAQLMRSGPAFQVGKGANGKNITFGASGWIDLVRTCNGNSDSCTGDINIDLEACPPD